MGWWWWLCWICVLVDFGVCWEFSPARYHHFRENEPEECKIGSWMEDYTRLHRKIMEGKAPPKFLMSTCGPHLSINQKKGCSGWGNQLEVIEAMLIVAMHTNRALVLGGYDACILPELIDSPAINWSFNETLRKFPDLMNRKWVTVPMRPRPSCSLNDLDEQTRDADVLYIAEKHSTFFTLKMTELGSLEGMIHSNETTSKKEYWGSSLNTLRSLGCFIRYLLHPSEKMAQVMRALSVPHFLKKKAISMNIRFGDKAFKQLGSSDWRVRFTDAVKYVGAAVDLQKICHTPKLTTNRRWPAKITPEQYLFNATFSSPPPALSSSPSLSPSSPFSSSYSFPFNLSSHHFSHHIPESVREDFGDNFHFHSLLRSAGIFLSTDNSSFIDEMTKKYPTHITSAEGNGGVSHALVTKFTRSLGTHKFEKWQLFKYSIFRLFLDFFLVGMSDVAIISPNMKNTFSLSSVRWGQAPVLYFDHLIKKKEKKEENEENEGMEMKGIDEEEKKGEGEREEDRERREMELRRELWGEEWEWEGEPEGGEENGCHPSLKFRRYPVMEPHIHIRHVPPSNSCKYEIFPCNTNNNGKKNWWIPDSFLLLNNINPIERVD